MVSSNKKTMVQTCKCGYRLRLDFYREKKQSEVESYFLKAFYLQSRLSKSKHLLESDAGTHQVFVKLGSLGGRCKPPQIKNMNK